LGSGILIAAPRTGSGKTLVTLGLIAALSARGVAVAPAKTGPDYIDAAILTHTAGRPAINLDPWAMRPERLAALAEAAMASADLLLVEGVMGLFDGAADGSGSTGDLAAALGLPVVLVVDAERQGQSLAPLVAGFAGWRLGVRIGGVILNRVSTTRHERLLTAALKETGIPVLGALPKRERLGLPERHLGLVLPGEIAGFDAVVLAASAAVAEYIDLDAFLALAGAGASGAVRPALPRRTTTLPPLGQRIAIARDDAFAFLYEHWLRDWRATGAELSYFSPLEDEGPPANADAVFLPGGYPELHAARLAASLDFKAGLVAAAQRGALLYGECGGFMVLGRTLTDKDGITHDMAGLLPVATSIGNPKRTLGYRRLAHASPLPWPARLTGHEFHYSSGHVSAAPPLFAATDARGDALAPLGAQVGRVMGSYAHVIDVA
jgi:cobyrinic acid a,c-diamide synthase